MDYDDIDKIADSITDDPNTNSGLADGVSMFDSSVGEYPRRRPKEIAPQRISGFLDPDYPYPGSRQPRNPILDAIGRLAKSVVVSESGNISIAPKYPMPKPAVHARPAAKQPPPPAQPPKPKGRILEL